MSEILSVKRIYLLLRKEWPNTRMAMLLILLVPLLVLVLGGFNQHPPEQELERVQGMFAFLLIIGGSLFASMAFSEMQDKQYNFAWFMLPASMTEKFIAQFLLSTVLYIVFLMLGYFLVTLVADLISQQLFGNELALFQPFNLQTVELLGHYLMLHAMFFLGAAFFRKRVIIKTLATLLFLYIILLLIIGFTLYAIYGNYPECRVTDTCFHFSFDVQVYYQYWHIYRWLLYAAVPLLLWFMAYRIVRKRQISHGV